MNALAHRVLVLVTGQPDSMTTPDTLPPNGCTGNCDQGRNCDCELSNEVPMREQLVRSVPSRPPIQLTGGPIPIGRRVRRCLRALRSHLMAPRF